MGHISVSDRVHNKLTDLKEQEEHTSLDSVVRVLLERAKHADSAQNHGTALTDSTHGTIQVTAGTTSAGPGTDPLELPVGPTEKEAIEFLHRICVGSTKDYEAEFKTRENSRDPIGKTLLQTVAACLPTITEFSRQHITQELQDAFPNTELDEDTVDHHVWTVFELLSMVDDVTGETVSHKEQRVAHILTQYYTEEGTPTQTEHTLDVDLDEVVALIGEITESETPRETARQLLTAGETNDHSIGAMWFLAPLCPDVSRKISDSGGVTVGRSAEMAWVCDGCFVDGRRATIDAVRVNKFGEVSQVQCGKCGIWSEYGLHERLPVNDGADVRLEWESERPA